MFSCAPAATSALMAAAELFAAALGKSRRRGEAKREEDREGMKRIKEGMEVSKRKAWP